MARLDPRSLRPAQLVRLLNSTPLGTVADGHSVHLQQNRAGYRIGDGRTIDLRRYTAWLIEERGRMTRARPENSPRGAKRTGKRRRDLTKEDLAPLLKVHVRTVTRYASEGMPHDAGGHGKSHLYNLEECQKWVKDEGRGQKDAVAEDPTKAQVDLKLRREKARLAELDRLEREGALHDTAECRHRHLRQLYVLKREFLALPRSVAPELEGHDRTETEAILRARITAILEQFAQGL